jgi:ABC transporter DrrB family efflux protein
MDGVSSAVHVEGVVKRFGTTIALAGVDLDVEAGTVFGLLGPNGAGKTTLVRVLSTLLIPDAGRAEIFGRDVVGEPAAARELLGLTGQFAAVDEILTGRQNLEMFGRLFGLSVGEARRRADELLGRFDLADAADRSARTYSGGMRRRLDLASSLLTQPRVLFLDEPTTGLDPRSRIQIWGVVRDLVREGTTVLLTTQYLEEADQLADEIAVIDHGRVIALGTGNELKDRIGGQILEVELTDAAQRDQAQAALTGIGCGAPEPGERPVQLTLPAPRDGLEMVEEAAAALRRTRIGVSDLGLRRPTLDDVFLQLTGAPPSENGGGPDAPATGTDGAANGAGAALALDGAGASADGNGAGRSLPTAALPVEPAAPISERTHRQLLALRRPSWRELRRGITDSAVVTVRNLRHFIRQPDLLIFSTIQPVMFVLLFVYVFGGAIKNSLPHGLSYVDYLLPGILIQSVTFRASQTQIGLSEDLQKGVVDRFRSMPMARSAVLIGRTAADLVRNVLIVLLMIGVGYAVGFRFHAGIAQAAAAVAVVTAFGLALSWVFAFVALIVRSNEAGQSAGFVVLFPLVFASSVFVPTSSLPGWLAAFAKVSPVTLAANTARSFSLYPGTPGALGGALAWVAGILAAFVPLCVWRYRRMT